MASTDNFSDLGFEQDAFHQLGFEADEADKSNPNIVHRLIADALIGLSPIAKAGQAIGAAPAQLAHKLFPNLPAPEMIDFDKETYGVNNQNIGDKLLQGAVGFTPFAMGEGAILKGIEAAPALAKALSAGQKWALPKVISGAAYDIANGGYGPTGALANLGGSALAEKFIAPVFKYGKDLLVGNGAAIKNAILNHLDKSVNKSAALSPELAAENIVKNFSGPKGEELPVDIGSVTRDPFLQSSYNTLKNIPFSGATEKSNRVASQTLERRLSDAQDAAKQQEEAYKNALNIYNDESQALTNKLNTINPQIDHFERLSQSIPKYLNDLADSAPDRGALTSYHKKTLKSVYDSNWQIAKKAYEPINNSDIRFDLISSPNEFSGYKSALNDLRVDENNFSNLFGQNELGNILNSEISKAKSFFENGKEYPMDLKDVVSRMQNLGKLEAAARSQGNRNEARLLGSLRDGLENDVHSILKDNNYVDISNQLLDANNVYKTKIVPFWANTEIRKSVTDKSYIAERDKLAKALHAPSNQKILEQLPSPAQNSFLYQLITGGKGTSKGFSKMSNEEIARRYSNLDRDYKAAISRYNPAADKAFENLQEGLDQFKNLKEMQKSLASSLEKLKTPADKDLQKSLTQVNKLKNEQLGAKKELSENQKTLADSLKNITVKAAGTMAIPFSPIAKKLTQILSDPELSKAYIAGKKFPEKSSNQSLVKKLTPLLTTSMAVESKKRMRNRNE